MILKLWSKGDTELKVSRAAIPAPKLMVATKKSGESAGDICVVASPWPSRFERTVTDKAGPNIAHIQTRWWLIFSAVWLRRVAKLDEVLAESSPGSSG